MPVTEQTTVNTHNGNGVSTVFAYSFKILDQVDIEVRVDGVVKTLTTDYSVSGVGNDGGGSVTMVTAPASGTENVVLRRAMAYERSNDYQENGDLDAVTLDEDADRPIMLLQQLVADLARSLKLPVGTTETQEITESSVDRAGKVLAFDASGNLIVAVPVDLTITIDPALYRAKADDVILSAGKVVTFEGATDDAFETTLTVVDPTADNTLSLPNKSGTLATTADITTPPQISVQGTFKNLAASATGTGANIAVSYDEIVLEDGSNAYVTARSGNLTINTAGSGANGLDTGSLAANTWYSVWVIRKPDGTTAGLISLSATAPTMPSGYTYKSRVSWIRTDGSGNKYPLSFKQYGRRCQYVVSAGSNVLNSPIMASGTAGTVSATPTWAAVAVGNYVPQTAARILGTISPNNVSNWILAAPNNSYGGYSTTNPAPCQAYYTASPMFDFGIESSNIYLASANASATLTCFGWEDNL